ncbi:MAG: DEAD/DEAH box helicase [Clostridiaceae bacterium]|nr:DEAD/DEAH box helicase [Clostridiaceae bacterium]
MPLNENFEQMNLSPETLAAVKQMGFTEATPIQIQTIPVMLDWRDIIAKAPTGTGKTCAFGIPIMEHLELDNPDIQVLILSPTRELALQIADDLRSLATSRPAVRIVAIYGGQPIERQLEQLRKKPQIIIATPGRLIDHLRRRTIHLGTVHTAILDEADRMLDMGFIHDVRRILDLMPKVSQIAMFSATMSRSVMDISWIYQRDVVELTVADDPDNRPPITQYCIEASGQARITAIMKLMQNQHYRKVMIFCNTKYTVQSLTRQLKATGCKADCIHGDMRQNIRERVISGFRKGTLQILVATDVASRGLDIDDVEAVFNYDIPNENEYYIHRIGRTGRAKHAGVSYTFVSLLSRARLDEIVRYTRSTMQTLTI